MWSGHFYVFVSKSVISLYGLSFTSARPISQSCVSAVLMVGGIQETWFNQRTHPVIFGWCVVREHCITCNYKQNRASPTVLVGQAWEISLQNTKLALNNAELTYRHRHRHRCEHTHKQTKTNVNKQKTNGSGGRWGANVHVHMLKVFKCMASQLTGCLFINQKCFLQKNNVKYLGILIDTNLTWKYHIQEIFKKYL